MSLLLLLALAPLMAVIALLVRIRLGSPVLFRQVRPGRGARPFVIFKFRTMKEALDGEGRPLPDGERLTGLGRFLRSTSMDELPELLNVLKGEMSLVGPRPLYVKYLPYYSRQERRRHEVRPGITGWAQVNGRNYLPWEQRLALDVWYVENRTLFLDLRILAMTVWKVIRRDGVAPDSDEVERDLDQERRDQAEAMAVSPWQARGNGEKCRAVSEAAGFAD